MAKAAKPKGKLQEFACKNWVARRRGVAYQRAMSAAPEINAQMSAPEWVMLIVLALVFGGSFFFNGVLVRELPPMTIVFFRVALAAIVLHVFMRASGRDIPHSRVAIIAFAGMGLLNNVIPFSLIVFGQTHIASGVASIVNAVTPLFTVVVANFLTSDEKLTPLRVAGVMAGLAGVAVMIGLEVLLPRDTSHGPWWIAVGMIACTLGALSYAVASVFGRRFKRMKIDPIAVATGQVTASAVMTLPLMLIIDKPWMLAMPSPVTMAAMLALAVFSTAFAYILYFRILSGAGATNLSLVTFLVPVSAILLGIVFLGETILPRHIFGMALIGFGLGLVDGRLFRRRAQG